MEKEVNIDTFDFFGQTGYENDWCLIQCALSVLM